MRGDASEQEAFARVWPLWHGNAGAQVNLASTCWTGLAVPTDVVETYVWSSVSVHCSTLRNRPAEVLRDQSTAELGPVPYRVMPERSKITPR